MLLQLVAPHPEALGQILKNTPPWVGVVGTGLLTLGFSETRAHHASLARVMPMPLPMAAFSISAPSAFGHSPGAGPWLLTWLASTCLVMLAAARVRPQARYEPATRMCSLPDGGVPLTLSRGIFLTKYAVGVELALQPQLAQLAQLAQDPSFTLPVVALYGFAGCA